MCGNEVSENMSNFIELAKQARDQMMKRKEKKYSAFLASIEADPDLQEFLLELTAQRNGRNPRPARKPVRHKFSAGLEVEISSLRSQLPKQFRSPDVLKLLEERSFQFNSSDHEKAVKDAMYRMVKRKRLKVAEKGLYEFV